MAAIDPLTAGAVLLATAATDAVYVLFTSVCRDQLYGKLGLCRVRGDRFMDWRVCIDHLPAPAARRAADRRRARVASPSL